MNTKIRLISLLLCFVLSFVAIPLTSSAAVLITVVDITVKAPNLGEHPEAPEVTTDKVSIYAYEWYEGDERLQIYNTFESGKTYRLKIRATTVEQFSNYVTVKINDLPVNVLSFEYDNTHVVFERTFTMPVMGYTLSFDPGELGSGTMAPLTGKTAYTLPYCSFIAPSGKEFGCWRVDGTNDLYEAGETIILNKDTTVRAIWVNLSAKTQIYDIEASSNFESIPKLYGTLDVPEFTITKGAPAYIPRGSGNMKWQKKINDVWEFQDSGRFTPGEWRVSGQVRIDRDAAAQYELGNPTSLTVNGVAWNMANNGVPSVHSNYSMISIASPVIIVEDDPNIQPPIAITNLEINIVGYKLGEKIQNAKIECNNNIIISNVEFISIKDDNNDGLPDDIAVVGEAFEAGLMYAALFTLEAKEGYDLSTLGWERVTCPNGQVIGSYSAEDDNYQGMCLLIPFDVSATLGDVNNDGKIDQYDYILVKRHYFNTRTLTDDEMTRADANKDSKIDQFDYILIARHYFGTFVIA